MNIWENLIKLYTQMDIGNRIFEQALEKIGEYLKHLTEDTRVQAETACDNAANALLEIKGVKSNLTEEELQYLFERKIDAADYCAPFESFRTMLRRDADSLCNMREYLKQQPQTKMELQQMFQMNCRCHLMDKQIDYLGLNQFSVESKLTEAETAKFQKMFETLPSYAQIAVWEADLSILNAKLEKTFQDYENAVSGYARTVGENFSDYLKEKEMAAEKLKAVGFDDEMFENFVSKVERNAELQGKATQLERLTLWKKADLE